ncbi:helix-turn-helix transcriptional regulator [Enterococcus gilvus]|uniref:HTH araC/xylS-type domain-containing protein n=1 Tax=Enterococcus gilvus ATCC BAA-350 TaxID=1158614 RepID=R2V5N7_9ENTE|nr:AraC family transcriptional regulator [Enterococcus gilvus]EOI53050.1 hypothetical protein UKC_04029 [Enterococcus gilvus ATCC BAA-350]EOW77574.1 hypothetical protein I592_04094 [Enterococcus gilvus ATCC BAA-350]
MEHWLKANYSWSEDSVRYIHTPSKRTQQLFFHIQEIGHFKASKPYYTERENLPSYLMNFTLSGKGRLFYRGKDYELQAGDFFFIDCKEYQYYETLSDEPWEMDWIHFYGGTSTSFYEEFIRTGNNVVKTTGVPEKNAIHFIMQQLLALEKHADARTDFESSLLIHKLTNELIQQKYAIDFTRSEIPPYIIALKEYLDTNVNQVITLNQLEQRYHLNRYQIIKEFTQYIGTSPIDYLINAKLSKAKDLLRYSDLSVQVIAQTVGIENPAYFSRLFKKRIGVSPKYYRLIIV